MPIKKKPKTLHRKKPSARKKNGASGNGAWLRALGSFLGQAAVLAMIWGGIFAAGLVAWYAYDLPDISQITKPQRRPSITLLADDGTVFARFGDFYGQRVTGWDVSPNLVRAILAVEDRRFYDHFGIDVLGLLRATFVNLRAGHVVQGGSTITQQLAKNLFLTPERTGKRKIQEMLLAFWLERTYTKDQILSAYLNRVYLGAGAYGVDAAADVYFGKTAATLTLHESAVLAGLLRAPSRFSPLNNPDLADKRAKIVLQAMQDAGYISEKQKGEAFTNAPLPRHKPGMTGDGRYYADWIVDQVGAFLASAPQDITILTTLDLRLQREAERTASSLLEANGKSMGVSEAALVSMTPDGAVRAMVGGINYGQSQFNRATQARRQPGSAFKPIVYLAAIRQGLSPNDVFEDAPIRIGKWAPQNYDGKYRGPVTARQALAESLNSVAVRVMQKAGVRAVIDTARDLGISSPLEPDLSLALGTSGVSLLELTSGYAVMASGGRAVVPFGIKEMRDRKGRIVYSRQNVRLPLTVETDAIAILDDMLRDVVRYGTGRRAALDRDVAGKTGTSSDYRDAWFMGFTGHYVTGVWVGNDNNEPMKKVSGGNLPAMLWHNFMADAEKDLPPAAIAEARPISQRPSDAWSASPPPKGSGDLLGAFIRHLIPGMEVEPSYPEKQR